MIKNFKIFENKKHLNYKVGDIVLPQGDNPKNSYSIISEVINTSFSDYMIQTYDIFTEIKIEQFPIMDHEIVRKLAKEEIENLGIIKNSKKYNL